MKKFRYIARDRSGKKITGLVEAVDSRQAARVVRERGLVLIKLTELTGGLLGGLLVKFFRRTSLSDVATFTRQLSTMTTAGLQLTESLTILRTQSRPGMGEIITSIQADVQGGSSLADAVKKYPEVFSRVYVSLIKSGETAGVLDEVLSRLADNLEKQREFGSKVKGALIYPVIVVVGMMIVAVVMMVFVVPKLTSLYSEFGASLPLPTRILISASSFASSYWWLSLLLLVGAAYGYKQFSMTKFGRRKIDGLKLSFPIIGNLNKQIVLTEFSRTLSLLVGAGISIIDALDIVSEASGNVLYEESLKSAAKQVEKGFPLAFTLAADSIYPQIVPQMISVGEETGKVDEVLGKLAHYFETESEQMVKGLTTAVEPLIMVVLGIGVGFLVIAIIMPIYNLTSQF